MEKQFGKPLTIDLDYSLVKASSHENAKSINLCKKHQSKAGTAAGIIAKESGQFASIKTKEHQSNAGKNAGQKNLESGHWLNLLKEQHKKLKIEHTCPYCNKTLSGLNYRRWHGDNCKSKS